MSSEDYPWLLVICGGLCKLGGWLLLTGAAGDGSRTIKRSSVVYVRIVKRVPALETVETVCVPTTGTIGDVVDALSIANELRPKSALIIAGTDWKNWLALARTTPIEEVMTRANATMDTTGNWHMQLEHISTA